MIRALRRCQWPRQSLAKVAKKSLLRRCGNFLTCAPAFSQTHPPTMSSRGLARLVRRLASTGATSPKVASASHLGAIKCDNQGNAWKVEVQVGRGSGLLGHLHPRDAPLLERTGSFGDTPATLTSRPGMLIARFQPFSAVIGDSCALLMDSDRASSKVRFGVPTRISAFPLSGRRDLTPAPPVTPSFPGRRRCHRGRDEQ